MNQTEQVKFAIITALKESAEKRFDQDETATKVFMQIAPFIPGLDLAAEPIDEYKFDRKVGESTSTDKPID